MSTLRNGLPQLVRLARRATGRRGGPGGGTTSRATCGAQEMGVALWTPGPATRGYRPRHLRRRSGREGARRRSDRQAGRFANGRSRYFRDAPGREGLGSGVPAVGAGRTDARIAVSGASPE